MFRLEVTRSLSMCTGPIRQLLSSKHCWKEVLPGSHFSVLNYCSTKSSQTEENVEGKIKKLSKAMKAYVERARNYNDFIKKEEVEYNIGKRHLANMMGHDPETFTQEQIDEAIEYLFPSGIFDKKARPLMKPPHLVFPPKKDAQFDESGRPYNFLFYTGKPNFYTLLHKVVAYMNELNALEDCEQSKAESLHLQPLDLSGSEWITKMDLELKLVEQLKDYEYKNFIHAMERLAKHKYALKLKDFIMDKRKLIMDTTMSFSPTLPITDVDGRQYVTTEECPRKTARANVTVRYPGSGMITINGKGIEYFTTVPGRRQILFPLDFTGMREKVDIEASVKGGGETGQAGAIRWGISWGLRSFVPPEMVETMRLAGLLTRDFRRRERKKPGQARARKKFTWKKR